VAASVAVAVGAVAAAEPTECSLEGRGAAVGVISTGFDLGVAGGSFLGGLLVAPLGYGGMLVTTAGICLLGVAAFVAGVRTDSPRKVPVAEGDAD